MEREDRATELLSDTIASTLLGHWPRHVVSQDNKRAWKEVGFGYALYAGDVVDGIFKGTHRGCVETHEEAEAWLTKGEIPDEHVRLYEEDGTPLF